MKIKFNQSIIVEFNDSITMIKDGFVCLFRLVVRLLNASVHRWPYVYLFALAVMAVVISLISIGKARAERDNLNKANYELSVKVDSLQNMLDIKNNTYASK